MLVLGAGPGGYSAAFRAADLGMKTVLVERYPALGGVCLNVGCIPSKALLHIAAVVDETKHLALHGIAFGAPQVDLAMLRGWKNKVVGKLTGGLAAWEGAQGRRRARHRPVPRRASSGGRGDRGPGAGEDRRDEGRQVPARDHRRRPAGHAPAVPEDPRVLDSTRVSSSTRFPRDAGHRRRHHRPRDRDRLSTLGSRLDVVEMLDGLMPGADATSCGRGRRWTSIASTGDWSGQDDRGRGGARCAVGELRGPERAGGSAAVRCRADERRPQPEWKEDECGESRRSRHGPRLRPVDSQMRTNVPHIFAIGDLVGQPMLAHKPCTKATSRRRRRPAEIHFDARVIRGSSTPIRKSRGSA